VSLDNTRPRMAPSSHSTGGKSSNNWSGGSHDAREKAARANVPSRIVNAQLPMSNGTPPHFVDETVVGVLVHNEDPTIERCLGAILSEPLERIRVKEIVVVASGCTDRTVDIVCNIASADNRVRLIAEPERTGKAAAINMLLRATTEPVVVVVGGDVIFTPGSLIKLVEPLADTSVGMTGARPVPTNPRRGIVGNTVNILWELHHELSLERPKLGEAVAFRRIMQSIDPNTRVDEAVMEHVVEAQGLQLRYVPDAVVRNHGPETIAELIAQRARVYQGHVMLRADTGYRVSSIRTGGVVRATWRLWRRGIPARHLLASSLLEATSRSYARVAAWRGQGTDGIWDRISSSKRVVESGHVLRRHHDETSVLVFSFPTVQRGSGEFARAMSALRSSTRADDKLAIAKNKVTVAMRGDKAAVRSVYDRVSAQIPLLLTAVPLSGEEDLRRRTNELADPSPVSATEQIARV
jgi:biofilm PGA synthesis N-glycosyltransferase PgaC